MFYLEGELVPDADVEIINVGVTIDITFSCSGLSSTQLQVCSSSCNQQEDIECENNGITYKGACTSICANTVSTKVLISGCTCK